MTDENVDAAIQKGIAFIKSQRKEGHWETRGGEGKRHWAGRSALAVLALLYAGEDPRREDMDESLKWLVRQNMTGTYAIGVRAHALSLVPGRALRAKLDADVKWLLKAMFPAGSPEAGGYGYEMHGGSYDHSNSQYGVLGVWMAADAGINVPDDYWKVVELRWLDDQRPNGGWTYGRRNGPVTGSMTAAGLATLFVTLDKAHAHDQGAFNGYKTPFCGEHKDTQLRLLAAIDRAMSWFAASFAPDRNPSGSDRWKHYYLYGVERIGRASGQKYFRDRDWFKEGAAYLLNSQQEEGSWLGGYGNLEDTCFALMFLSHGRAPLLFSKLQHGEDWNNKLRDVAGLTRYAEKRFE
ncbi:MAG: hypothetical protein IID33_05565, partial [Planctomycetes bacterium]|nr:hypothetical protein [Planctomycetota bacterium]